MKFDSDEFGRALVEETLVRVLNVYSGALLSKTDPLWKDEFVGPILDAFRNENPKDVLKLLDHCSAMTVHAVLNHLLNFSSEDCAYSVDIVIRDLQGNAVSLFDLIDDPGGELVVEGGWLDEYSAKQ